MIIMQNGRNSKNRSFGSQVIKADQHLSGNPYRKKHNAPEEICLMALDKT